MDPRTTNWFWLLALAVSCSACSSPQLAARGFSGWTSHDLLPVLRRALREGPWRCVVIMAGINDVIWERASASVVVARLAELYSACDEAGVPVLAVTNIESDLSEFFAIEEECAERQATLQAVAHSVLHLKGKRAVVDARTKLPLCAAHYDDAIHLSPAGARKLAEVIFDAMRCYRL